MLLVILDTNLDLKTLRGWNQRNMRVESWEVNKLKTPFDVSAHDFLKFAKSDHRSRSLHGRVNALSNGKRAIDCQIDSLLFKFGLLARSRRKQWNFPEKMETLRKLGVVAPAILRKIVRRRNVLEHEYHSPSNDEVEDALDVAELFIVSTDDFLRYEWRDCEFDRMGLIVTLDTREERIVFERYDLTGKSERIELGSVSADSEQYLDYLKWFMPFVRHLS